jgi:hypothetical protein
MLGVFIAAALIAMVAVGQGANEAVRKQIESPHQPAGGRPGATTMGGIRGGLGASTLTIADVEALRQRLPPLAASAI